MKPTIFRRLAACAVLVLLAACGEDAPAPAAVAPPAAQPAVQPAVQPAPQKAAAAAPAAPDADAELAARVKRALEKGAGEIAQGVDVSAKRGVVNLFGTVASGAQRGAAGRVAASVSGVTSVDNRLVVVKGS